MKNRFKLVEGQSSEEEPRKARQKQALSKPKKGKWREGQELDKRTQQAEQPAKDKGA